MRPFLPPLLMVFCLAQSIAQSPGGLRLEEIKYPFPVQMFTVKTQGQTLEMAFMDVRPKAPALGTAVLLHGKNFCGAYWQETAESLRGAGYRVIIPDQIGFGKSSKPTHYQFSFHQLARNTRELLQSLGVKKADIVGHSMGGMQAVRHALMFPTETRTLVLVNPLGLEDWQARGVPYQAVDHWYQQELKQTPEQLKAYQLENYYPRGWKPEYNRWLDLNSALLRHPEYPRVAWLQALAYDMIFTQPVVYELRAVQVPTLLIIGQSDRTAIGKQLAGETTRNLLGNYPALGRAAAKAVPNARLVALGGIGHLPHIEAFPRFIEPLLTFLKAPPTPPVKPPTSPVVTSPAKPPPPSGESPAKTPQLPPSSPSVPVKP